MATSAPRQTRTSIQQERLFYLSMLGAIFVLVAWGFAPSFYLRKFLTPPATWIDAPGWFGWLFIVHGLLFTTWLGLFATQVLLIGSKRLRLHKDIGQAVWPLYFAIIAMGLVVGWMGANYGFHDVPFDSVTFSTLPWLVIISFATLCGMGLRERRDPQRHKRMMLIGTLIMADAGIARVGLFHQLLPPWLDPTLFMLIPILLWDLHTLGRVHKATLLGSGLAVLSLLLSIPIGHSFAWHGFAKTVLGIEGVPPTPPV